MPDVSVPFGSTEVFLMHRGRLVSGDEGAYIRKCAEEEAMRAWGERRVMGAMAAARQDLHDASVNVCTFRSCRAPAQLISLCTPGEDLNSIDLSHIAFKVHMSVGAS